MYQHNFEGTPIGSHPYVAAPNVLNGHLSGSSWTTSQAGFGTNYDGFTGKSLSLTNAVPETRTITLTFDVQSGHTLDVSSYSFYCRNGGSSGYQNWSMTINGIAVGSGTVPGSFQLRSGNVANPISGLTGTVTVVLALSGGTNGATNVFRLDNFTLNGFITKQVTNNSQFAGTANKRYRYGFNGKENDNEPKGVEGGQQDYGMRIYDPRVGRFLSVDPLAKSFPMITPYQFAENSTISGIDLDGEEFRYYLIHMVQQNGKVVLLQPILQRVEKTVQHKVELITGHTVTVNFPRRQAWVANVGFYNYKFASYQAMQNAIDVLKDPETEKKSRECHCLPGIDLAYTVEAEEQIGQFFQNMGNAAAMGVAAGTATQIFGRNPFSAKEIERVLQTSSKQKGKTTELLRAFDKKLGQAETGGFKSVFEGIEKTTENLSTLVKDILKEPAKIVRGKVTTDVYNSAGQGVRIKNSDSSFQGFIEIQKATR